MTQEDRDTIVLVFIGQRLSAKGKMTDFYLACSEHEFEEGRLPALPEGEMGTHTDLLPKCYRVYHKMKLGLVVGGAVKVPQIKGTSQIYSGEAKYIGTWPNEEDRNLWKMQQAEDIAQHGMKRRIIKDKASDDFLALKPLRDYYGRLPFSRRSAFLASIIEFITRG